MKKLTLGALLAVSLTFTSCLGPNSTTNTLRNWNANVTENKYANEGIFVLTSPLYAATWLGDVLVFNSWKFWTGDDLWLADPGAYPTAAGK